MRKWIYGIGCPEGNEQIYIEKFEKNNREVLSHFKERPNDLLVLNLENGDGWEKLCLFLGKNIPMIPFPQCESSNRQGESYLESHID